MKPHDPSGSANLKEFRFSAYRCRRSHEQDPAVPLGEVRRADRWQELNCLAPADAYHQAMAFLERAAQEDRLVSGVLIASDEEQEEGGGL